MMDCARKNITTHALASAYAVAMSAHDRCSRLSHERPTTLPPFVASSPAASRKGTGAGGKSAPFDVEGATPGYTGTAADGHATRRSYIRNVWGMPGRNCGACGFVDMVNILEMGGDM